jgi:hypothetical protein
MFNAKWFILASLFLLLPSAFADAYCPGKVAGVHVRHIQGSITIVAVKVNHTGPYDFMLDTGSQITTLDSRLAAELHLKAEGTTGVIGVGSHATTNYAHVDLIEIGPQAMAKTEVFFQNVSHLQASDPGIRGVIGGNILQHFDVLLDQDKNLLCLDTEGILQRLIRGERISFATPPAGDGSGAGTEPLIAEVQLPHLTVRPLYLLLDSGANIPFLCSSSRGPVPTITGRPLHITRTDDTDRVYVALPVQDVLIGRSVISQVSFVVMASGGTTRLQVDGLLPTGLFRRVYISYTDRFMVLEPW